MHYFVGSLCEIGSVKLDKLGQKFNVPNADTAVALVLDGGASLLPEDMFLSVGFTEQELKSYAFPGQRAGAPDEFKAKMQTAFNALHEYRKALAEQRG